jgi:hypothetical protein
MPFQQLWQELLMDRDLPLFQRSQLPLIVVHENHLVTQIRKTSSGHQAHVTGTHHRNPHLELLKDQCVQRAPAEFLI